MTIIDELSDPPMPPQYPDLYEVIDGEIKEMHVGARQVTIAFRSAVFLDQFVVSR